MQTIANILHRFLLRFLVITAFGVMASKTLEDVMSACGVEPVAASHLIQLGWTVQTFACSALDLESFDKLWALA